MRRVHFLLWLVLALLAGCTKPDLPNTIVRSSTAGELTKFRAELGERFPEQQLKLFDAALNEIKLEAVDRGVKTASAREELMLAAVNGKTVLQAQIIGWQARRTRLLSERKQMAGLLEGELQTQQKTAANGTPQSVLTHIQNARDILARLERDLADVDRQLADWGAPPGGLK